MSAFRDFLRQAETREATKISESVDSESGIGFVVVKTLAISTQVHIWHLLAKIGQKHTALGSFYDELNIKVDGLAEKFIATGGVLPDFSYNFSNVYSDVDIVIAIRAYRDEITVSIDYIKDISDKMSILDGLTDLMASIDNFIYQFNLD